MDENPNRSEFFLEDLEEVFAKKNICLARRMTKFLKRHVLKINGNRVISRNTKVSLLHDTFELDGNPLVIPFDIYIVMNKIQGCLCTARHDGDKYKTVFDYVPEELTDRIERDGLKNLHTVGRLDGNTEGLLILTTNGDFSHRLVLPENEIPKTYEARLRDIVSEEEQPVWIEKCAAGMQLDELWNSKAFFASPAVLEFVEDNLCRITVTEGKYHEVKRIFHALGNEVVYLKRISMGNFQLPEELEVGQCRLMTEAELVQLSCN